MEGVKGVACSCPSCRCCSDQRVGTATLDQEDAKGASEATPASPVVSKPDTPPPKEDAFEQFKNGSGSEIHGVLVHNKGAWWKCLWVSHRQVGTPCTPAGETTVASHSVLCTSWVVHAALLYSGMPPHAHHCACNDNGQLVVEG